MGPNLEPVDDAQCDDLTAATGQTLNGRYRLLDVLGEGGMGRVFAAEHLRLGCRVAVKVIRKSSPSRSSTEQFLREARALARLSSRHVVRVLDADVTETGEPFMVLELLSGSTLEQAVAAGASQELLLQWVEDALAGLAEAHREGIAHRDIKPQNVFVAVDREDPRGSVAKVVDFGLAKLLDGGVGDYTARGDLVGTLRFIAPEQFQGKPADARTDVFAFGVMIYWLLARGFPFLATEDAAYPFAVLTKSPRPLPPGSASPELSAVVMRCLQKDPAARFDDAQALRTAFRAAREASSPQVMSPIDAKCDARDETTRIMPPTRVDVVPPRRGIFASRGFIVALIVAMTALLCLAALSTHRPEPARRALSSISSAAAVAEAARSLPEWPAAPVETTRLDPLSGTSQIAKSPRPTSTSARVTPSTTATAELLDQRPRVLGFSTTTPAPVRAPR